MRQRFLGSVIFSEAMRAAATHKRVVQSSSGEHTTTSIIEQNFGGGGAAPSRVAKAIGKKVDPKKQAEETRQKEQKAQELKAQDQTKQARAKELHAANRPVAKSHGASTSASKPGDRSTWIEQAATHFNWGLEQARKAFQGTNLKNPRFYDEKNWTNFKIYAYTYVYLFIL